MEGKFSKLEKIILLITFALIITTLLAKLCIGVNDTGVVFACGFFEIMIYIIILVVSLFPATWRMTSDQRAEIKDQDKYQSKYRLCMVILDFVMCMFFNVIIIFIK